MALVCHHDSVERGPGAGDDGAAVATLIETARALKAGPGLENDIFFVFTDGEEIGLLGAQAFVAESPWARRVAVVLNFDARGASGPVYMFETSAGNRWLIRQLARSAPRPAANSLMYEVYRHMPNDTDLTIFRRGGLPGLNFAFIAEPWIYHSPGDTPEHLSRATLQHQGSYALSLARQFGQTDLSQTHEEKNEDSVYFDLFSRALVWYPGSWAIPLALVGALSLLAAIGVKAGTRQASWGGMAVGFVAWIPIFVVIGSVCRCLPPLASAVWPQLPGWRSGLPFLGCGILATLILGLGGHRVLRKWLRPLDLAFAALLWWAILSVATAVWLPGASYVTIWPLAFVLGGILRAAKSPDRSWQRWCWLVFGALPALLLISPLILAFYVALGPDALLVPMIVLALETALLALPLDAALSSG